MCIQIRGLSRPYEQYIYMNGRSPISEKKVNTLYIA